MPLDPSIRTVLNRTKGFMPDIEGEALAQAARLAWADLPRLPIVEVGSYCGRSTLWLGSVSLDLGETVVTVDHHRGSAETQAGWEHHDPEVVDRRTGLMDTMPFLRATLHDAGLEDHVIAVVGASALVASIWSTPAAMVFIDGGHGVEPAIADRQGWVPHVAPGGLLAIHDVFPDPADGGRPPYECIYLPVLESGEFDEVSATGSLRVLRRR